MLHLIKIDPETYTACLIVAIIDFFFFNWIYYTLKKRPFDWHKYQFPMLFAVGGLLWYYFGLKSAGEYALLHLCFFNDWQFYGIAAWLNLKNGWENRQTVKDILRSTEISHSNWTLYGRSKQLFFIIKNFILAAFDLIEEIADVPPQVRRDPALTTKYSSPGALANMIQAGLALLITIFI